MSWPTVMSTGLDPEDIESYGRMLASLRAFQDAIAAAAPDRATLEALSADLDRWTVRLEEQGASESAQVFGHVPPLPVRGHAMVPPFAVTSIGPDRIEGTVTFGRFFVGGGHAVHGGAISLLFDEILGVLATSSRSGRSRTAYLHVDYRALAPIETELAVTAWFDREEGRKRYLRGELRRDGAVCAEVEGLFVELRPDQG